MIQFYMVKYSKVENVIKELNLENARCYAVYFCERWGILNKDINEKYKREISTLIYFI